ncbi:MAG TPA: neutral/alkaline non-lysosomal ceramidase N-terminal domain-containing protein, partial [Thermoleophilaceae bacterium]|nr:neutral/alkaline non-lysosomal ceramidase N-terminal domain-containing protein [Thermoleophilaceae bacterium]
YYLGGWTRADRIAQGQHTRLFSRAMVLERQGRKFALVQVDLFMVPGGMVKQIGEILAKRGFSERNILISASHTHSGPGGYANFPTLNTAAPSLQTATDPLSFARFLSPDKANPLLYTFLTRQIATAIRRADDDRAMATAGWGSSRIMGLTQNRSIEAHLANHGIVKDRGTGKESDDPGGYEHTIDPNVDVLRVDKVRRAKKGRRLKRIPIGAWSTFADHGTVTKSSFQYYNADHHASAMRVFEERVRSAAKVPARQEVLNVYGNSNEGDMSAGLTRDGPAASDYVGRVEAAAMYDAWRAAGRKSSRTPAFSSRWTRVCFCGQVVEQGQQVASQSQVGIPFLTGSEEERGPLFDITGEELEDRRTADAGPPHGVKASVPGVGAGVPNAVPLVAFRLGRRMIVSLPAEGTKEMGARIKSAVRSQIAGSGIGDVVLSGLANEFILYLTTPQEYDRQHYEGGNTQFGRQSGNLLKNEIAGLAGRLARNQAAPDPYAFDPTNGVAPTDADYGPGAASASVLSQPRPAYARLQRAELSWQGGTLGLDRPVDKAFVTAQRLTRKGWKSEDSDLGLAMLWSVDDRGRYRVRWEIPRTAPRGTYRLLVTGKRYQLASNRFRVFGSSALKVTRVDAPAGKYTVALAYPAAVRDVDLTFRPRFADGGRVRFKVGSRTVTVKRKSGIYFSVKAAAGTPVTVAPLAARDRNNNANGSAFSSR